MVVSTPERVLDLARLRASVASGRARQIREAAHISRSELAAAIGVTEDAIGHWERGRRLPQDPDLALRYGALLDALDRQQRGRGDG